MKEIILILYLLISTSSLAVCQIEEKLKFWLLKESIEDEIGIEFPQIQTFEGGWWDISDSLSVYGQIRFNHSPSIDPPFGTLILHKDANPTDILSSAALAHHGFVMSKRTKDIFEQYCLGTHWFYPVKVRHKKKMLDYYVFHTNNKHFELFDTKTSMYETIIVNNGTRTTDTINIRSRINYFEKRTQIDNNSTGYKISPVNLKFRDPNQITTDIIGDRAIDIKFYISDKLKQDLQNHEITGITILEQTAIR